MNLPKSLKLVVNGGHFVLASNRPGYFADPPERASFRQRDLCRSLCTVTEPVSLSLSGPPQSGPPGQRGVVVVVVGGGAVVANRHGPVALVAAPSPTIGMSDDDVFGCRARHLHGADIGFAAFVVAGEFREDAFTGRFEVAE